MARPPAKPPTDRDDPDHFDSLFEDDADDAPKTPVGLLRVGRWFTDPPPTQDQPAPERPSDKQNEPLEGKTQATGEAVYSAAMISVLLKTDRAFRRFAADEQLSPKMCEAILRALASMHRMESSNDPNAPTPPTIPILVGSKDSLTKASVDATPLPSLPKLPPESWASRDLNKRENPMEFLNRVYSPPKGFQLRQLRPIDPDLYRACSVWLHRHPEDRIEEPPSPHERMAKIIEQLSDQLSDTELRRLGYAIDAHFRRKKSTV